VAAQLADVLTKCRASLDHYARGGKKIGEAKTKASLIEPVIGALGWDTLNWNEVCREYRHEAGDNPVDYALLLNGRPELFIEAKGLARTSTTRSGPAGAGVWGRRRRGLGGTDRRRRVADLLP